jgi:hypothetical protein
MDISSPNIEPALDVPEALNEVPRPLTAPWLPIAQAPRDGTLLILAIAPAGREHALEDTEDYTRAIGFNSFDDTDVDEWQFCGWCWSHDHFVAGQGEPLYFQILPPIRDDV